MLCCDVRCLRGCYAESKQFAHFSFAGSSAGLKPLCEEGIHEFLFKDNLKVLEYVIGESTPMCFVIAENVSASIRNVHEALSSG